ncbi:hypothetical protein KW799_00850 [Candidatus Parcubacteria bacterium]|nr:hypothetical protein [Candidatus Parcubacteria bacterium]
MYIREEGIALRNFLNRSLAALVNRTKLPRDPNMAKLVTLDGKSLAEPGSIRLGQLRELRNHSKIMSLRDMKYSKWNFSFEYRRDADENIIPVEFRRILNGMLLPRPADAIAELPLWDEVAQ